VPALIRWPGKIKPNTNFTELFSAGGANGMGHANRVEKLRDMKCLRIGSTSLDDFRPMATVGNSGSPEASAKILGNPRCNEPPYGSNGQTGGRWSDEGMASQPVVHLTIADFYVKLAVAGCRTGIL
jgi:hypothetical protein